MAEIHIERKKNVWPGILGLIVIALLIWGAFALMGDRRPGPYAEQPAATAPATTTAADPAAPSVETTTGDAARDTAPRTDDPTPPRQ